MDESLLTEEFLRRLHAVEFRAARLAEAQAVGGTRSLFHGRGMTFSEVRPYQVGDDVRFIDWNVSARMNEPYVKIFTEEREVRVLLLVDVSTSQSFASTGAMKARATAEVAALIAFASVKHADRVGLITFSSGIEKRLPPGGGRAHAMIIAKALCQSPRLPGGTDLAGALRYTGRLTKRRTTIFVISDFLAENFERALADLAQRHELVALRVSDPNERILPAVGFAHFVDPETGECGEVDTSDVTTRVRYERAWLARQRHLRRLCQRTGTELQELCTSKSYLDDLVSFFRRRSRALRAFS